MLLLGPDTPGGPATLAVPFPAPAGSRIPWRIWRRRLVVPGLIGLLIALAPPAAPAELAPAPSVVSASSTLAARLDALLDAPPLDRGFSGAKVVALRTGATLYARNADRRFIPASNTKLFTSAVALDTLRPALRLETLVLLNRRTDSPPEGLRGAWNGDLALVGGGDPSTTVADLEDLARQVAATGLTLIHGDLITDDTLFVGPGRGPDWGWDWESDDYAAPASALTVERGQITVTVTPAPTPGHAPRITITPREAEVRIRNLAMTEAPPLTGASLPPATLRVRRLHAQSVVEVTGALPPGAPHAENLAIDDPAALAGRVFRAVLERAGVHVTGRILSARAGEMSDVARERLLARWRNEAPPSPPWGMTLLARRESAPVSALLREMNLPSDNQFAETFIRLVGVVSPASLRALNTSPAESAELGLDAERAFLDRLAISDDEAHFTDGSGVGRKNQVTPTAVVKLLQAMAARPDADLFIGSLPLAGRTGTLARRMRGSRAEGNLRAKTGTVTGASALAGVVTTRTGERLAFSLLMTNYPGPAAAARAVQDRFCELLADIESLPPP